MELQYGAERSRDVARNERAMAAVLARLRVIPFDEAAAREAGQIRAYLAAQGTPIGPYDVLLAGHARALGLTMVTNNVAEFSRVPRLKVENWLAAE